MRDLSHCFSYNNFISTWHYLEVLVIILFMVFRLINFPTVILTEISYKEVQKDSFKTFFWEVTRSFILYLFSTKFFSFSIKQIASWILINIK